MTKNALISIALFLAMVFIQVVCNRICLFNIAVPFVYIYFIVRLPMNMSVNWVLTLSFLLGLAVDIFSNTYGMNAMACTIISVLRKPVFALYCSREDEMSSPIPSIRSLGAGNYIKYMFTITLLFCSCIYLIQLFTFRNFLLTFLRIIGSTVLTSILLFGFDCIATTRREKRL